MTKIEERIYEFLNKNRDILFFVCIFLAGILIRWISRYFISGDMQYYLEPWFSEISKGGGLASLDHQIGDYNLLYQTIIALFTYTGIKYLFAYKILSVVFDYLLAYNLALLVCEMRGAKRFSFVFNLTFALVLLSPTVFINSSMWSQCDSIYACFVVLTIRSLLKHKGIMTFVWFGVALSFKLQSVFILPFIVYVYLKQRDFSLFGLVISVLILWSSGILCYINGRDLLAAFTIYGTQTVEYPMMYLNYSSFWMLISNDFYLLRNIAILITFMILGIALYSLISHQDKYLNNDVHLIQLSCWTIWTCVLFLPSMHERYSYIYELLLVVLLIVDNRHLPLLSVTFVCTMLAYSNAILRGPDLSVWTAIANIAVWIVFTKMVFLDPINSSI